MNINSQKSEFRSYLKDGYSSNTVPPDIMVKYCFNPDFQAKRQVGAYLHDRIMCAMGV